MDQGKSEHMAVHLYSTRSSHGLIKVSQNTWRYTCTLHGPAMDQGKSEHMAVHLYSTRPSHGSRCVRTHGGTPVLYTVQPWTKVSQNTWRYTCTLHGPAMDQGKSEHMAVHLYSTRSSHGLIKVSQNTWRYTCTLHGPAMDQGESEHMAVHLYSTRSSHGSR
ncbi:hypothetical protein BaRGS_00019101 [Batillaria attramentaria]|uniref:Uncharacterized protein n=1 Tax=Batillaria attramentaria TaxID=370345 RepID=A0ABD0KRG2_9CAEN